MIRVLFGFKTRVNIHHHDLVISAVWSVSIFLFALSLIACFRFVIIPRLRVVYNGLYIPGLGVIFTLWFVTLMSWIAGADKRVWV